MLPNWKNWREFFLCITQAGVGKPALVVFFLCRRTIHGEKIALLTLKFLTLSNFFCTFVGDE